MPKLKPNDNRVAWVLSFAAIAILALVVGFTTSCDERKAEQTVKSVLAPLLPLVAESVLNSDDVQAALGKGGEPLAQAALAVMLPLVQNEVSKLAGGNEDERLAYRRIQEASPDLAAMFYRIDENGVPLGLWPRLDSWLKFKGYKGAAELYAQLQAAHPAIKLTPDHQDELIDLMGPAIVEEYLAVKASKATFSLPDFEREYE